MTTEGTAVLDSELVGLEARVRRDLEGQRWETEAGVEAEKEPGALTAGKGFILEARSTAGAQA